MQIPSNPLQPIRNGRPQDAPPQAALAGHGFAPSPADAVTLGGGSQAAPPALKTQGFLNNLLQRHNVAMESVNLQQIWDRGYTGKGVGIAVLDSGVYPHPDFKDRIVAWQDFVNGKPDPYDDEGHGTHVAGDAARSGAMSGGLYKGAAPEANIVALKVSDAQGSAQTSTVIKAVQWAIANKKKYNIRVLNLSMGSVPKMSYKDSAQVQALEQAVKAGIVVCVAAGNDGPGSSTVTTPGNAPDVITVGDVDPHGTVNRNDDAVDEYSGRGPTAFDDLDKPEVVAPGERVVSPRAPLNAYDKFLMLPPFNRDYRTASGTSMASPIVAGLAADLIQANPKLTPAQIKEILMAGSNPVPDPDHPSRTAREIDATQALDLALGGNAAKATAAAKNIAPQYLTSLEDYKTP